MNIFAGWGRVAALLDERVAEAECQSDEHALLDKGQRDSVLVIAERLRDKRRALLIADEVGMGKTRIAAVLIDAVRRVGGRTAIVLPGGLGAQWQAELRLFDPGDRTLLPLRSYESFVMGYGRPGEDDLARGWQERRDARLRDRRQQRELPEYDWRQEKILMISHTFAQMRFPEADGWRRELMLAYGALLDDRRRNMRGDNRGERRATHRAAYAAIETLSKQNLDVEHTRDWRRVPSDDYRRAVLPVIGRALGQFDLVVVDEAHKARGADSSLSRILGPLIWESKKPFRLGMTATPVELDADQWRSTLDRLLCSYSSSRNRKNGVTTLSALEEPINVYSDTAKRLRTEPLSEALVAEFEAAANCFTTALAPYVIRRDKRSDRELREYEATHGSYRDFQLVSVAPSEIGRDWLRAFCAAEALSLLPNSNRDTKRHRLVLEKAHGLDKLILEGASEVLFDGLDFWSRNVLLPKSANIFEHPAILAAVRTIESVVAQGRKVLVFGTLLEPLHALTRLLDARAMLRHLSEGRHWPTSKIHGGSEAAVGAALLASDRPDGVPNTVEDVNRLLAQRYRSSRRKRDDKLGAVHREIITRASTDETALLISQIWPSSDPSVNTGKSRISLLLEALESRLVRQPSFRDAGEAPDWTTERLIVEVRGLVSELSQGARDSFDGECSESPHSDRAETPLQVLSDHLESFSRREGNFARLLYGRTAPQTRRLLQAAFNRESCWPMVLVAQSLVGREGLNLHEECRDVVLLHAEWNPGVIEQQIGRVDRKNSRFLKDYRAGAWRATGMPPRIEIRGIRMDGGYDSLHWSILTDRWDALRAQLHGDVVALDDRKRAQKDLELARLVERIDQVSPDFYPRPKVIAIGSKRSGKDTHLSGISASETNRMT
jgi:hypothetical protein